MWTIFPAKLCSSYVRKASASTTLKLEASPDPIQSVPSGSERTVPIECEAPSEGMQSLVFDGVPHGALEFVPNSTVSGADGLTSVLSGLTVTRVSRDTIGDALSGLREFRS